MALSLFRRSIVVFCALAGLLSGGCAVFDPAGNRDALFERAAAQGWRRGLETVKPFTLLTLERQARSGSILAVYIEGDGRAWLDRSTPSANPTPERPVGLRLALSDPSTAGVLYIARPCQYLSVQETSRCDVRYWTGYRYAPEVVDALSAAIDRHKSPGDTGIQLIGYSGGGVLAALVAARRTDVRSIVTVAANLDLAAWTAALGVDPLRNSLDPAREAGRVAAIAQYHLAGADDDTVPPSVIQSYVAAAAPAGAMRTVDVVRGYDHDCCWHRDWATRIVDIRNRLAAQR